MKKLIKITVSALVALFFWTCEETLIKEKFTNTPRSNYDMFWTEFDLFYGAFEAKGIDWDSLGNIYGESLSEGSTDRELFAVLRGLLNELNDGHADLNAPGTGFARSWHRRNKSYFSDVYTLDWSFVVKLQSNICRSYLNNQYISGDFFGWNFFYGIIPKGSMKIGYLCIPTFSIDDYPIEFIQSAVDTFNRHTDAVVIDLRYNGGGRTEAFVSSLNSFATEKRCYLKSKFRDGPAHKDFTNMEEHWTHPHDNGLKGKPVAILMNAYSASSSDHFILGMKSQSNVILIGDTTCGAFSSVLERMMPNGWKFRLGAQVVYGSDGELLTDSNGRYLEGIGIAPDVYVPNQLKEIRKGIDVPLSAAIKKLKESISE